jgi:hypothetical protein
MQKADGIWAGPKPAMNNPTSHERIEICEEQQTDGLRNSAKHARE